VKVGYKWGIERADGDEVGIRRQRCQELENLLGSISGGFQRSAVVLGLLALIALFVPAPVVMSVLFFFAVSCLVAAAIASALASLLCKIRNIVTAPLLGAVGLWGVLPVRSGGFALRYISPLPAVPRLASYR